MQENDLNLNSRFDFAYEATKLLLENNSNLKNVFDIGSGNELMKDKIKSFGMNYTSFDLFPINEHVKQWNVEDTFPYEGKADIIIMLEVIEHLNNPWLALKNISSVLNEGGYLILSTPNPTWSGSRLSLLRNGYLDMFKRQDLELNHHVFIGWRHIVERVIKDNGFSQIEFKLLGKSTSLFAYPFWGLKLPFRLLFRLIKIFIEKRDSLAIGALYGVVAKKVNKI